MVYSFKLRHGLKSHAVFGKIRLAGIETTSAYVQEIDNLESNDHFSQEQLKMLTTLAWFAGVREI